MKIIVLLIPMILFSCNSKPTYKYYCSVENQIERAMFVENCISTTSWITGGNTCHNISEQLYCVWGNDREKAKRYYNGIRETLQDDNTF